MSHPLLPAAAPTTPSTSRAADAAPLTRRALRERERAAEAAAAAGAAAAAAATASTRRAERTLATPAGGAPRRGRSAAPAERVASRTARARTPGTRRREIGARLLSLGVLLFTGAMVVGLTVPPNLVATESSTAAPVASASAPLDAQSVRVQGGDAPAVSYDGFTVSSYAQIMRQRSGNPEFAYTTDWTGPIRWPFPYPVPISSGFGPRSAPIEGAQPFHEGVDFTPGAGAPIYAIADGVVSLHESGGSLGNHVVIDHVINGQKVQSVYAHMQAGSSPLTVGQQVHVGDLVGLVGQTGLATGPHLHLEIHLDGVPVDPFAWLKANASS